MSCQVPYCHFIPLLSILAYPDRCYLDHAGATLPSATQIERHTDLLKSQLMLNPHSADSNDSCSVMIEDTRHR